MAKIEIGDKVKYSRDFLRSIGELTGALPFAKGTVINIKSFATILIAEINWNDNNFPKCVNINNLVKIGTIEKV